MSIPHGLLALLGDGPRYGYQLRAEFERATGSTWPLNIGQVYTTLTRLERDGLVTGHEPDAEGRQRYELTASGREALAAWFAKPVTAGDRPRDELAIKLALAATTPGLDVRTIVQTQRTATMQRLQQLTRLKRDADPEPADGDLAWSLVLDNLRFTAEAELRWLDHCEGALTRARRGRPAPAADPVRTEADEEVAR
ncbi:helix-turn-helix transcriptional regulator [Nocardioides marinquilinus]|uniref:Helix-turn-helix transcriptional regulator n=1 Tax=Nocardioides marinquilinus TaxID=1210400 RepID=A0ABP9Q4B2_9ACTN